ncbi:hypothetical protein D3C72_2105190 [compost metagenome]
MVFVDDGDVADPLLLHQIHRLFDAVLWPQGEGMFGHDFGQGHHGGTPCVSGFTIVQPLAPKHDQGQYRSLKNH